LEYTVVLGLELLSEGGRVPIVHLHGVRLERLLAVHRQFLVLGLDCAIRAKCLGFRV
jgi:hypothetical protein